jgi:hypothetical protein
MTDHDLERYYLGMVPEGPGIGHLGRTSDRVFGVRSPR